MDLQLELEKTRAEIKRLKEREATLLLLIGDGPDTMVVVPSQPKAQAQQETHNYRPPNMRPYKLSDGRETRVNTFRRAIKYTLTQMHGQFLTRDVVENLKKQGLIMSHIDYVVVGKVFNELETNGELRRVATLKGRSGNTWIRTAEMEQATKPEAATV